MAQDRKDRFICDGCGMQFESRSELQKHEESCPAMAKQGASGKPMSQTAGEMPPEI